MAGQVLQGKLKTSDTWEDILGCEGSTVPSVSPHANCQAQGIRQTGPDLMVGGINYGASQMWSGANTGDLRKAQHAQRP